MIAPHGILAQGSPAVADFTNVHQRIDGFGASDVWNGTLSDAQADLFFSTTNGIGLSILRVGIDENGNNLAGYSNATKAAARGAIVWAAPWTAPGAWKDNGSLTNGGHLLPAYYDAWATRLAAFAGKMQQNAGVPLYGVSVQNEPDYTASYNSMLFNNQEMANFVKVLGPKLAALNPRPKLLSPDVSSWGGAWGFTSAILNDSVAAPFLDIIAVHQYAGISAPQTSARPIWQTEQSSFEGFDPGIGNGLMVARWIHDAITTGGVSAWHYWWLIGLNGDDEGLIGYSGNSQITKRLYTFGNYSKFVRPGFVVVDTSGAPGGVSISAYKNPATGDFVVVAINQNGSSTPVTVALNGLTASSVTPWVTSGTLDLAQQSALAVSGGSFTATLPASSVTSFVSGGGVADTTAPTTPTGLTATAVSSSQINLSWTTSTDNVGVAGYRINRNGTQVGTSTTNSYGDAGLSASTTYSYTVVAYDGAGNTSSASASASATTQAVSSTPGISSLSPTSGSIGTSVTIAGTNFGATQGSSSVTFNGAAATPSSWSATQIVVPVPGSATTGPVVVTVGGVNSNSQTFSVTTPGTLPAPWTSQDVGNPAVSGQASHSAGTFTVSGAGTDIWNTADQFRFVYQPLDGDGSIVARVGSLQNTDVWAKAGVMIREDLSADAPNALATVTAANGMSFQQRGTRGAQSTYTATANGTTAPQWIRLVRSGSTFTGSYSANGTTWITIASASISLPSHVYIGVAVTSHNSSTATTAAFDNVTVTTATPNRAPVLNQPANQSNPENAGVSLQLSASDPDGNPLTYSATGLPANLSLNTSTGLISGTLSYASAGTYSVTTTASDGTLGDSKTFTWTVTNVNRTPVLSQPANQTGAPNATVSLQLSGSDPDGGSLTYGASGLPPALTINAGSGLISGTLSSNSAGTYSVTVNVSDGSLSDSKTFTWNVTAANSAPVLSQPPNQAHAENAAVSVQLSATDPDGNALTYSATNLPANLSLNSSTGLISGTLSYTSAGTYTVTASASDGALSDSKTFTWTVSDVAQGPSITSQSPGAGQVGATVTINGASFGSTQSSSVVRFNGTVAQTAGSWSDTRIVVAVPAGATTGPVNVTVGGTASNSMTFTITTSNRRAAVDFDGDRRSDITVFHPSTGAWSILSSSTNFTGTMQFIRGAATDIPVPGDFDGDGLTDVAVFHGGAWDVLWSGSNYTQVSTLGWGRSGDVPVVADYDGDGKSDLAIYRSGSWEILLSGSNNTRAGNYQIGGSTDRPVVGDYDGDGRADAAVYQPATGVWRIVMSRNFAMLNVTLGGVSGDVPIPGDYDGDGKTDIAIFRASSGTWLILKSSNGYAGSPMTITGGQSGDIAVVGDYDGDGQSDCAVFRPSAGTWFVLTSSSGYTASIVQTWGQSTDTPLPKSP